MDYLSNPLISGALTGIAYKYFFPSSTEVVESTSGGYMMMIGQSPLITGAITGAIGGYATAWFFPDNVLIAGIGGGLLGVYIYKTYFSGGFKF